MKKYKISVFVPDTHLEKVKEAMFLAGAGRFENYDQCCFISKGIGQFRALEGANPFIGKLAEVEKVEEYKLEMMVKKKEIKDVIRNLYLAHPYEEPAIDIVLLEDFPFIKKIKLEKKRAN